MNHMNNAGACTCPHHKSGAIIIILLGLTFLLGTMGVLSSMIVGYALPVLVILLGITKLMGGSCKCYAKA
ncbi:MAG: hypothetical protein JWL82_193 [Parcubacteria group bacterium]|nr:hypothetical protein [Parcubacteria group bacterium]